MIYLEASDALCLERIAQRADGMQVIIHIAPADAFEAAEGASQTAGESLATVDIVTLRTACAAFHAQALDAEQAAQAAQAALDAARERREAARAARAAKPDGKVHPSDAKPAPAKKKGWFKKKK